MPPQPRCEDDEGGSVGVFDVFDVQRPCMLLSADLSALALPGEFAEPPKHPFLGVRIGEAANLGPPDAARSCSDGPLPPRRTSCIGRGDAFGHS